MSSTAYVVGIVLSAAAATFAGLAAYAAQREMPMLLPLIAGVAAFAGAWSAWSHRR